MLNLNTLGSGIRATLKLVNPTMYGGVLGGATSTGDVKTSENPIRPVGLLITAAQLVIVPPLLSHTRIWRVALSPKGMPFNVVATALDWMNPAAVASERNGTVPAGLVTG